MKADAIIFLVTMIGVPLVVGDYASWSRWLALRAVTGVACKHTKEKR